MINFCNEFTLIFTNFCNLCKFALIRCKFFSAPHEILMSPFSPVIVQVYPISSRKERKGIQKSFVLARFACLAVQFPGKYLLDPNNQEDKV